MLPDSMDVVGKERINSSLVVYIKWEGNYTNFSLDFILDYPRNVFELQAQESNFDHRQQATENPQKWSGVNGSSEPQNALPTIDTSETVD